MFLVQVATSARNFTVTILWTEMVKPVMMLNLNQFCMYMHIKVPVNHTPLTEDFSCDSYDLFPFYYMKIMFSVLGSLN